VLIRRVSLKNIRSYNGGEEARVEIPNGVTLFEGDIGSGKSTLLYAVEFALFGLGDSKGTYLLSENQREGHVEVSFVSEGRDYVVRRGLRRRGDEVVQEECCITADGITTKLSPSDLKQRVVAILKFNEPTHPRAESLVYRYAVFTPQEQMKEILMQKADTRLQVIRRVLGVQSYQVAADNSELVSRKVAETSLGLKSASKDLEDVKSELQSKEKALANLDARLPGLVESESELLESIDRLETKWKELRDKRERMRAVRERIPLLEEHINELRSQESDDRDKVDELEGRLKNEIESTIRSFESRPKPVKDSSTLDSELEARRRELGKLQQAKAVLRAQLDDLAEITSKGICPVCGQRIPQDFSAKSDHVQDESAKMDEEIAKLEELIPYLALRINDARSFEEEERAVRKLARERASTERDLLRLRDRIAKTTSELSNLSTQLAEASAEIESMKEVSATLEKLDAELLRVRELGQNVRDELTRTRTRRAEIAKESERLSKIIVSKEAMRTEARRLAAYRIWLDDFFQPTVKMIEERTLNQANSRFNYHFQRFFSSLVEDPDMVVRVKEDFSPVFERQGFEQDFEALSGGERTSMALAYRFALNSVVREDISAQTELMILDEPTDGFSKEQIYKMRDLLGELDAQQVIMVSHEKELEAMADNIFRVEKENGTSKVSNA
jgi:exonuclease SbcC